jgi:hypothetical protein
MTLFEFWNNWINIFLTKKVKIKILKQFKNFPINFFSSVIAQCTNKRNGYDCKCPATYIDGNPNEPGRICVPLLFQKFSI